MAKSPDKPDPLPSLPRKRGWEGRGERDPAKHSKKDPAKPTRAKAARPDISPLDAALADLLNPAIGQGRAGVGSQTGVPSPLAGEGREGGREVTRGEDGCRDHLRRSVTSRPPPPSPPHKGEGSSKPEGGSQRQNSRPHLIIPGTGVPTLPMRTRRAPRSRAVLPSRRSPLPTLPRKRGRVGRGRRRNRPVSSIPISPARSASRRTKAKREMRRNLYPPWRGRVAR